MREIDAPRTARRFRPEFHSDTEHVADAITVPAAIRSRRRVAYFVFPVSPTAVPDRGPRGCFSDKCRSTRQLFHRHAEEDTAGEAAEDVFDSAVAGSGGNVRQKNIRTR